MNQPFDELSDTLTDETSETDRPSCLTLLILLLLIIALLTSLIWPLLRLSATRRGLPPTPTPMYLQET